MARNGSGTYALVNTASIATGNTISSTDMMATLNDIATALTQSIAKDGQTTPSANIPMGGNKLTGLGAAASAGDALRYEQLFTTSAVTLLGALNQVKGADIASAGTINLTTATGNGVHITGTTAITAVTLGSGMIRWVIFDGALTLTHHATNNNLPGAANITTAAGDRALYWADGTTTYCLGYFPAAGTQTYSANLAGIAAITPAQGDVIYYNGSAWTNLAAGTSGKVLTTKGAGANPVWEVGTIVQVVEASPITSVVNCTTAIPQDDTIPQNTEGDQVITVTITPTSSTSRLRIEGFIQGTSSTANTTIAALFQDSTASAIAISAMGVGNNFWFPIVVQYEMAAGTTSATTFKIRVGCNSGAFYVNGSGSSTRAWGGASAARLRVTEIKA